MTTKTNLTAWRPTPAQAEARDEARYRRFAALERATNTTSIHEAQAALRDMERADRQLRLFAAIQSASMPGQMIRLTHAALLLQGSSGECPHCSCDHQTKWVKDLQSLECDDARAVLRCGSCDGVWSVPSVWLDDQVCERCDAVGPVDDLGGEALCESCARDH